MVRHVMNDGTVRAEIKGHIVDRKAVPDAYTVLSQVRKRQRKEGKQKTW